MSRTLVLVAVLCGSASGVLAQENAAARETSVYAELLGPTEFASLNVERLLADTWSVRAGLQVAGSGMSLRQHYVQLPASLSYLRFVGPVGLEAGAGIVGTINPQYDWDSIESFLSTAVRSRPLFSSVFVRAEMAVLPTVEWRKQFGVGIGWAF